MSNVVTLPASSFTFAWIIFSPVADVKYKLSIIIGSVPLVTAVHSAGSVVAEPLAVAAKSPQSF